MSTKKTAPSIHELLRDKARLDYLESAPISVSPDDSYRCAEEGKPPTHWRVTRETRTSHRSFGRDTLRAAIDDSMENFK